MQTVEALSGQRPAPMSRKRPRIASRVAVSPIKRVFDIVIAGSAILFLLPALILIAIAVKLDSKGPVIFKQRRSGLNGRHFHIYKFRSMTVMEDGDIVSQAKATDRRVTRIGGILRRTSLDELPQFFNILKGDMSFVGPRPHALSHDKIFSEQVDNYDLRFLAKPGLTGLAQVRGFRGEIRDASDIENRVESDIEYIETWSFAQDVKIMMGTVRVVLGDENAY